MNKATAWRRGQVILNDTPLASAVAEMNRHSSVKLVIEDAGAADLLVNGLFQAGDSLSFATGIARIYGLQVIKRHNELVLSGLPVIPARAVHKREKGQGSTGERARATPGRSVFRR